MPHTPRIPTPAGEQLDAAVEAKVGSASRDRWELREEMKHVMSGALAEHLRGLSATDREDDLVEKVAKFVGAMETRVVRSCGDTPRPPSLSTSTRSSLRWTTTSSSVP